MRSSANDKTVQYMKGQSHAIVTYDWHYVHVDHAWSERSKFQIIS